MGLRCKKHLITGSKGRGLEKIVAGWQNGAEERSRVAKSSVNRYPYYSDEVRRKTA